jgi:hypothetical protein
VAILVASTGNSLAEADLAEARFNLMTGGLAVLTVELLGGDLDEVPSGRRIGRLHATLLGTTTRCLLTACMT